MEHTDGLVHDGVSAELFSCGWNRTWARMWGAAGRNSVMCWRACAHKLLNRDVGAR